MYLIERDNETNVAGVYMRAVAGLCAY